MKILNGKGSLAIGSLTSARVAVNFEFETDQAAVTWCPISIEYQHCIVGITGDIPNLKINTSQ